MITLSNDEITFFRENGYLIKRKVLDPDLMTQARDRLWEGAPPELDRHRPKTWVGAFAESRWTWKFREPGEEAWMVQLLATDPSIWTMAEQLLGKDCLQIPERIRGIYCIFPEGDVPERSTRCHVDRHPFHLGVVGYIDHVPPGGGGFTVWPGSHQRFYYDFVTQYSFEPTDQYALDVASVNEELPVECHGEPGDIVFWHHRIGHSAGHNRSSQIRQAVLYDFKKKDLEETKDKPPAEDMWRDWEGVRQVPDE